MSDTETDVQADEPDTDEVTQLTAAQVVRAAREQMGLTQKEVADQLFLTTSFIRYIDEGDYEKIPKPAFTRGYLRSYARIVGLDGDALVGLYEVDVAAPAENLEIRDVTEETVGSSNFTGPVVQTGVAALVAVIVLIALVWWFVSSEEEPVPVVTLPPEISDAGIEPSGTGSVGAAIQMDGNAVGVNAVAGDEVVESAADAELFAPSTPSDGGLREITAMSGEMVASESDITGVTADERRQLETVARQAAADVANVNTDRMLERAATEIPDEFTVAAPEIESIPPVDVEVTRVVDGEARYVTVDAGGFDEVEILFNDECWVEITNVEGASLYGDLNRDGDVMRVLADTPLRLLFGRAAAVTLKLNGEDVDLAPHTTREATARLTLNP